MRLLIRPPFGLVGELGAAGPTPASNRRDPRRIRDLVHDMRMPPFMRDSDAAPMSLTRRQYDQLMDMVDRLRPRAVAAAAERDRDLRSSLHTPARSHVQRVLSRRRGRGQP